MICTSWPAVRGSLRQRANPISNTPPCPRPCLLLLLCAHGMLHMRLAAATTLLGHACALERTSVAPVAPLLPATNQWTTAIATNFSQLDPAMWTTETGCFSCKAPKDPETVFECTNNTHSSLLPGSIAGGTGLTIVTTRRDNAGACTPHAAGGTSGHISSKQALHFGTVRVKARFMPPSTTQ